MRVENASCTTENWSNDFMMPAASLAPFEGVGLTTTLTSTGPASTTTRYHSNSTGSETQVSDTSYELRTRVQTSQLETIPSTEDSQEFYLGDIYACVRRPFDCFLSTHAEREYDMSNIKISNSISDIADKLQ